MCADVRLCAPNTADADRRTRFCAAHCLPQSAVAASRSALFVPILIPVQSPAILHQPVILPYRAPCKRALSALPAEPCLVCADTCFRSCSPAALTPTAFLFCVFPQIKI